jgi:hypothetical protein
LLKGDETMNIGVKVASYFVALLGLNGIAFAAGGCTAPPQACAVGYAQNTFHSVFHDDLDLQNTRAAGFHWYLARWFGYPASAPSAVHANNDGTLTVLTSDGKGNYTMGSAAPTGKKIPLDWVGTAFGGGGYFEAELEFNPDKVMQPGAVGWPSWWLQCLEHSASAKTHWGGQLTSYEHYIEVDPFEYNQWKNHPHNEYSGAVHDWYGVYGVTCPHAFCQADNYDSRSKFFNYLIATPSNTNFREFHKFGVLWVPATKQAQGYVQFYFDGKPTGDRVTWDQYRDEPPPPTKNSPWAFGILDRQHLILVLGTGNDQPMTVKAVNVWQASDKENLRQ